jgi:hypothetical protein
MVSTAPPVTGQPPKGVLRDLLSKLRGSMVDRRSRSMIGDVRGGEPGASVPPGRPSTRAGPAREQLEEPAEREVTWPHEVLEADGERRLEAENAERRELELEALLV